MIMSTVRWQMAHEIGADLRDKLASTKGDARARVARQAARDARLALEIVAGPEAAAARTVFFALEMALSKEKEG
jgi:hypothetical protein